MDTALRGMSLTVFSLTALKGKGTDIINPRREITSGKERLTTLGGITEGK